MRIHKNSSKKTQKFLVWFYMIAKCKCKSTLYYKKNITVCDRWSNSFDAFISDMGTKPFPKAQIDRINNDGNYEPKNCRWVTHTQNQQNKSNNKLTMVKAIQIRGEYKTGGITCKELGVIYGVSTSMIWKIVNHKAWK